MSTRQGREAQATTPTASGTSPGLMLALATLGFAVNFWAWALISPLGPLFRAQLWCRPGENVEETALFPAGFVTRSGCTNESSFHLRV